MCRFWVEGGPRNRDNVPFLNLPDPEKAIAMKEMLVFLWLRDGSVVFFCMVLVFGVPFIVMFTLQQINMDPVR